MTPRSDNQYGNKKIRLAILSVTISLAFAIGIVEVAVRLFLSYNSPETIHEHSLKYVPSVFARSLLKPEGQLVDVDRDKAWGVKESDAPSDKQFFISERGYRGPSFEVRKPKGITRIIVIGGSAVFDQNVGDTKDANKRSWPHLIEKHLRHKGFPSVEVINAGIPGHASSDSLGRLFSQLWLYEPDMVVVYQGWNDIKYWQKDRITPERPLITHVKPHNPTANPFTHYRGAVDQLLSMSQIYIKLRNRYFDWKIEVDSEGASSTDGNSKLEDKYSSHGPQQFRLNLELIVKASQVAGAKPVLVSQATLVVNSNSEEDIAKISFDYQDLTHAAIIQAYSHTYQIIRDVAASTGTDYIDAAQQMNGNSKYFSDHVHTSPEGSAKLAEIVADSLAKILVLSVSKSCN